jgi:hypothetical protein
VDLTLSVSPLGQPATRQETAAADADEDGEKNETKQYTHNPWQGVFRVDVVVVEVEVTLLLYVTTIIATISLTAEGLVAPAITIVPRDSLTGKTGDRADRGTQ